jgi:hypothetical protein
VTSDHPFRAAHHCFAFIDTAVYCDRSRVNILLTVRQQSFTPKQKKIIGSTFTESVVDFSGPDTQINGTIDHHTCTFTTRVLKEGTAPLVSWETSDRSRHSDLAKISISA